MTVTIADRNDTAVAMNGSGDEDDATPGKANAPTASQDKLGMAVATVPQDMLSRLKISGGVAVSNIKPGSFADDLPLSKGDIITEVNRHATPNLSEFESAVAKLKSGDDVVFVVRSPNARGGGGSSFVGGRLP